MALKSQAEYIQAAAIFSTYDQRVADNSLTVNDAIAANMRAKRDELLAKSDWMMLNDTPTVKTTAAAYRQLLRDLPLQGGWPLEITWPSDPYTSRI